MGGWVSRLFSLRPESENPTIQEIEARQNAENAWREAEAAANAAREQADQIRQNAEQESARARERQKEAARAAEEMERLKAEMQEAAIAAKRAEELAEASAKAAKDAERYAREAQEESERAQKMKEDAERDVQAAREEAERAQKAADEQRRVAEEGKALAEEMARVAAEEARKANEAKADAENRLKEGIQPVVTPTSEELAEAKRRIQYRKDCFHFAVVGISDSGKSSLVNAFRGLRSSDLGAAAVGVTETTLQTTRYQHVNPENPYVWYDIPCAGTFRCRDWQYFNDQGLYVFDCIIVLFHKRFMMTDIAILTNARRFNIPTYIVRSKADQHIRNLMIEMGYDSDGDEEDVERRKKLYQVAQKEFVDKTRKSVRVNLEDANIPDQRVYIVSNSTLLSIMLNKQPKKAIDEKELIDDLFNEAYARRPKKAIDEKELINGLFNEDYARRRRRETEPTQ